MRKAEKKERIEASTYMALDKVGVYAKAVGQSCHACSRYWGNGIKGILLDYAGKTITERERVDTPRPATPGAVLALLDGIAERLQPFDRVSVGFPGVVKHGATLTAHNLDPKWAGFELETVLTRRWKKPVRVANDAAVQGFGAIHGKGVELVITLGTGFGSSLFTNGCLTPGLKLAHHPWRKNKTYEDYLGKHGLAKYGRKRWNKLLLKAIDQLESLFNFDHMYIGRRQRHKSRCGAAQACHARPQRRWPLGRRRVMERPYFTN